MPFFRKAVMFGDGAKGMRLQVYGVFHGETAEAAVDTGIRMTATKKDHSAPWVETITLGDETYPTRAEAIEAWRKSHD